MKFSISLSFKIQTHKTQNHKIQTLRIQHYNFLIRRLIRQIMRATYGKLRNKLQQYATRILINRRSKKKLKNKIRFCPCYLFLSLRMTRISPF